MTSNAGPILDYASPRPRGKLRHFADQPVVKLFTDHLDRTLQPVAQMIRFSLGHGAAAPVMPLMSPDPIRIALPDEKTFDRLVDVHRAMRSREVKR